MSRRKEVMAICMASVLLAIAAITGSLSHANAAASALSVTVGAMHTYDAWARINPVTGRPSSAYMTLHNSGTKPDALISATTPLAGRVELHQHQMDKGMMRMRKVDAIAIAPQSRTTLAPSGYHLMMFDLKSQPKPGTRMPVTLRFKSGIKLTLDMVAQAVTAMGPAGNPALSGAVPATAKMPDHHSGH